MDNLKLCGGGEVQLKGYYISRAVFVTLNMRSGPDDVGHDLHIFSIRIDKARL